MRVFIDTNILLDLLLQRVPFYASAARLFDLLERDGHEVLVSAMSFNNVYYISRKSVGKDGAIQLIRTLRNLCTTVPLTDEILDDALSSPADDFEDGIQAASAAIAG